MSRRAWFTLPVILLLALVSRGVFLGMLYLVPFGLDLLIAAGRDKRRRYTPFALTRRWTRFLLGRRVNRAVSYRQQPAVNTSPRYFPESVKREIWLRDRGMCRNCGDDQYLEYDHVVPWSRGGYSTLGNGQLLCRRCNNAKGATVGSADA